MTAEEYIKLFTKAAQICERHVASDMPGAKVHMYEFDMMMQEIIRENGDLSVD